MKTQIKSLTGLRFLAAFYVFVFHLDMPMRTPFTYLPEWVRALVAQGRLGVTVFFVLSGFLLTYSHLRDFDVPAMKGPGYWAGFMFKRLARIYPVFLVGLLVCWGISHGLGTLPPPKLVLLSAAFLQTYFGSVSMQWYDMGTWSVANEFFFYLLFPLALPLLLRIRLPLPVVGVLVVATVAGTALGVGYARWPQVFSFPRVFAFPPSRFPEFVAGMAGALLFFRFGWRAPAWAAGLLLVATAGYLSVAGPRLQGTLIHNWLVVPTLVVVLNVLAQPHPTPLFKWLGSPPMEYLGRISYSFYIAQHPLVFVLDPLIRAGHLASDDWRVAPVAFVLNLLGAVLLYELVEKPAQAFLLRHYHVRFGKQAVAGKFA